MKRISIIFFSILIRTHAIGFQENFTIYFIFLCNTVFATGQVSKNPMNLRVQYGWIFLLKCVCYFFIIYLHEVHILFYVHLIVIAIFARRLNVKLCIISLAKFLLKCKRQTSDKNRSICIYFYLLRVSKCTLTIAATATERGRRVHTI